MTETKTETKPHKNIHLAMLAAQAKLKNPMNTQEGIYKDKAGKARKYAGLPDVRNEITPALFAEGLYNAHFIKHTELGHVLETVITHAETGEQLKSEFPLILEKNTPQGMGSAITYARRYTLCALLNIVGDEDDDGQGAEKEKREPPKPVPAPKNPRVERMEKLYKDLNNAKKENNKELFDKLWTDNNDFINELAVSDAEKELNAFSAMTKLANSFTPEGEA